MKIKTNNIGICPKQKTPCRAETTGCDYDLKYCKLHSCVKIKGMIFYAVLGN